MFVLMARVPVGRLSRFRVLAQEYFGNADIVVRSADTETNIVEVLADADDDLCSAFMERVARQGGLWNIARLACDTGGRE